MFYEKFKQMCEDAGISPSAACRAMIISEGTWRRWREGSKPRGENLSKLCRFFGVTASSLINDDEEIQYTKGAQDARQMLFESAGERMLFDTVRGCPEYKLLEWAAEAARWKAENGITD